MKFPNEINLGNKRIGGDRTFIIAEIGSNHNQDIKTAYKMIDVAVESGADAVKFQSIRGDKLYLEKDLSLEQKELLKKIKLEESWTEKLINYCKRKKIIFFSAPTYLEAVELLYTKGIPLFKIASPQAYGFPQLIRSVGATGIPTIMSTGYCNEDEIYRAIDEFEKTGNKDLVLLHCISQYPNNLEDSKLGYISKLASKLNIIIGYSDHTLGRDSAVAAVALGAKVIEKHITIDKSMDGPDHFFAMEPKEFKDMVEAIRNVEKSLSEQKKENLTKFEKEFREKVEMKLFFNKNLEKGHVIKKEDITYFRSETGMSSWKESDILGKRLIEDIEKYTEILGNQFE